MQAPRAKLGRVSHVHELHVGAAGADEAKILVDGQVPAGMSVVSCVSCQWVALSMMSWDCCGSCMGGQAGQTPPATRRSSPSNPLRVHVLYPGVTAQVDQLGGQPSSGPAIGDGRGLHDRGARLVCDHLLVVGLVRAGERKGERGGGSNRAGRRDARQGRSWCQHGAAGLGPGGGSPWT